MKVYVKNVQRKKPERKVFGNDAEFKKIKIKY